MGYLYINKEDKKDVIIEKILKTYNIVEEKVEIETKE